MYRVTVSNPSKGCPPMGNQNKVWLIIVGHHSWPVRYPHQHQPIYSVHWYHCYNRYQYSKRCHLFNTIYRYYLSTAIINRYYIFNRYYCFHRYYRFDRYFRFNRCYRFNRYYCFNRYYRFNWYYRFHLYITYSNDITNSILPIFR